jgi:hypothetical protein
MSNYVNIKKIEGQVQKVVAKVQKNIAKLARIKFINGEPRDLFKTVQETACNPMIPYRDLQKGALSKETVGKLTASLESGMGRALLYNGVTKSSKIIAIMHDEPKHLRVGFVAFCWHEEINKPFPLNVNIPLQWLSEDSPVAAKMAPKSEVVQ